MEQDYSRNISHAGVSVASVYMRQVFGWMTVGLGLTALVAWYVANTPALVEAIFSNILIPIVLVVAQLGVVIALSAAVHRMSSGMATGLFVGYAALTGVTMASIFVVYPMGSIAKAFMVSAGTFAAMSMYGAMTKRDLTGMGSFLIMGLIGLIIAMLVNLFLQSPMMDFVISAVGVLIFTGLTAYDTQKLCQFGAGAPLDDAVAMRRGVILGALTLYLDFINLFLMLLRLFGNRE